MNRRIMKKKHKKQILQEIFRICKSPTPEQAKLLRDKGFGEIYSVEEV